MSQIKYLVKAEKNKVIAEESLDSREQRDRWIENLRKNGWRVISKSTKGAR